MMDKTERHRLAAVLDQATHQRLALASEAMPSLVGELESQGIETPAEAVTHLCSEMERKSSRARDLILRQPPKQLLGYVWSKHYLSALQEIYEQGHGHRPNKVMMENSQFLLEFVHATWSCSAKLADERSKLSESEVKEILDILEELRNTTLLYCLMRSACMAAESQNRHRGEQGMWAMAAWVNLRGRRYQTLEEEFLEFVLNPHDEALRKCYDMGAAEIAAGVQAISDVIRTGITRAVDRLEHQMKVAQSHDGIESIDPKFRTEVGQVMDDLLQGGICNLSRHTNLSHSLLEDISYSPGENTEFLAEGKLRGTPLRTLPSLVKPGIKLGGDYYVTEGQFVRDVAFRSIQRGLLRRSPSYWEDWNRRQKRVIEEAFTKIFSSHLRTARAYHSVFYREPKTGNWMEADLVVVIGDVLLVTEAKAGVMAMRSPAEDFDTYMATVERLIVKAYRQCKRSLECMASATTMPIYARRDGEYVKMADLRLGKYRKVLPIGLTVESMCPFSTCLHDSETAVPLLGKHVFMSMSVDDLLVLRRFLSTAGELFHYLDVKQQACSVPNAVLLDEMEHLGAYISLNRYDAELRKQRTESEFVIWNSFADVVDRYFEGENASGGDVPRQKYAAELAAVLNVLDKKRPTGWLAMDATIRNLGREHRDILSKLLADLKATLRGHDYRHMTFFNETPILVWACASDRSPQGKEVRRHAEVASLLAAAPRTRVLLLSYNKKRKLTNAACESYAAPHKDRRDYMELEQQAAASRRRLLRFSSIRSP